MPPSVTLKDVAAEAGIHASAVSRVLRDKDQALRLSERRRQEIKAIAERMGYRPNAAAAATVSGRFNSVSLVCGCGDETSTLPQNLVYGLTDALSRIDMQLTMARLSDEAMTNEMQMPLFLRQHSCDGLLLNYTHHVPPAVRRIIEKYRIPSIWLNVKQDHDCVHPDDLTAGRDATRWLLGKGHTKIAYLQNRQIHLREEHHYSGADRLAGYHAEMQDAGRTPSVWEISPETGADCWEHGLAELFDGPDAPTAVVGYGSEVDQAVICGLTRGLNLGRNFDAVRFKDTVARFGNLRIPTLRIPQAELGQAAVKLLLKKIRTPAQRLNPVAVPFLDRVPTLNDYAEADAPARPVPVAPTRLV